MRKIVKEKNYDIYITLTVLFVIDNFEIRNLRLFINENNSDIVRYLGNYHGYC